MVLLFTSTYTLAQSSPRPQLGKAGEFALLACDSVRSMVPNAFLGKAGSKTGMTSNFAPQDSVILSSSQLVVDAMDNLRAARLDMAGRSGATYLGQHYAGVHTLSGGVYVIGHNPAIPDSTVGIPSGSCPNGLNANVDTSGISAVLTLTGDSSSVFIFNVNGQAVLNGLKVKLGPGVLSQNVFWNIYGAATISNVSLVGTMTVGTGTIGTYVSFGGSLLSIGGITYQGESYSLTSWGQSAYNPNFGLAGNFAILAGGSLTSDTQLGVNDTTYIGSVVTDSLASDSLYPSYNVAGRKALRAALDYRASKLALAADHIVTTVNNRDTINVTSGITSIPPGHYNNLVFNLEGDTLTSTIIRTNGNLTLDSVYVFKNNKVRAKDVFWLVNGDLTINNGALTGTYIADKVNLNQSVTGVCGIVSAGNIAVMKSGAAPTFRFAPVPYLINASLNSTTIITAAPAPPPPPINGFCPGDPIYTLQSSGSLVKNYGFDYFNQGPLDYAYLYPSSALFTTVTGNICEWEYLNSQNRPPQYHTLAPVGADYASLNLPKNAYNLKGTTDRLTKNGANEGILMLQWNNVESHFITQRITRQLTQGDYLISCRIKPPLTNTVGSTNPENPVRTTLILNPNPGGLGIALTQERPLFDNTNVYLYSQAGNVLDVNGIELAPLLVCDKNIPLVKDGDQYESIDIQSNFSLPANLIVDSWLTIGQLKNPALMGLTSSLNAAGVEAIKFFKAPNAKATYRGSRSGQFVEGVNPTELGFSVTYTWYDGTTPSATSSGNIFYPTKFNPEFMPTAPSGYYTLKITHATFDGVNTISKDMISTGYFEFNDDLTMPASGTYCSDQAATLKQQLLNIIASPPQGYSNVQFFRMTGSGEVSYNVNNFGSDLAPLARDVYSIFYIAVNTSNQTVRSQVSSFEIYRKPAFFSTEETYCWSQNAPLGRRSVLLPADPSILGRWHLLNPDANVSYTNGQLNMLFRPTNGPKIYNLIYVHGPCTTSYRVIVQPNCNIEKVVCEAEPINLSQFLRSNPCFFGTIKGSNGVDICTNTTVNLGRNPNNSFVNSETYVHTDFRNSNKVTNVTIHSIKDITVEYASEDEWANNIFVRGSVPLNYCKTCSIPDLNLMQYRLGNFTDYYNTLLLPKVEVQDLSGNPIETKFLTTSTGLLNWSDETIALLASAGGNVVFSFVDKFDNTVVSCLTKSFPENNFLKINIVDFEVSIDEKRQNSCEEREISVITDFSKALVCGTDLVNLPMNLTVKVYLVKDNTLITTGEVPTGSGSFNIPLSPQAEGENQLRLEISGTYDGCNYVATRIVRFKSCCNDPSLGEFRVYEEDIIVRTTETLTIDKDSYFKGSIIIEPGGNLRIGSCTVVFAGEAGYEATDPLNPVQYPRPTFSSNFHGIKFLPIDWGHMPYLTSLTLEGCTLRSACNTMWSGIDISVSNDIVVDVNATVIQDAERALRLYPRDWEILHRPLDEPIKKDIVNIRLTNSKFENNYIGLDLDATWYRVYNKIESCTFSWTGGKLPVSDDYNVVNNRQLGEYGRYYGQVGIKVKSNGAHTFTDYFSTVQDKNLRLTECRFQNLDFGIVYDYVDEYTYRSRLKSPLLVDHCQFTNIHLASIFDYNATSEDPDDYSINVKNSTFTDNGKDEANRLREQNDITTGSTNPTVFGHEYLEFHSPSIFSRGYMRVEGNTITNTSDNEGLLSSVGTLGMGKQEILNNTITGQKHGILTFGGENEIKGNTFLDNREAIYVGPASSAVPNRITTKLELNCNLFQTPGTKWAGLPLTGVYVGPYTKFLDDRIGGPGNGTNPIFPGGNAWPLASGIAVPTVEYNQLGNTAVSNLLNGVPRWLSPPYWSSISDQSGGNPINYFPYKNEFVEVQEYPLGSGNYINNFTELDYSTSKYCYVPQHAPSSPTTDQKEICDLSPLNTSINFFPLARIGAPSITSTGQDKEIGGIVIFPNPTSGNLSIELPDGNSFSQMEVRDVTSQIVLTLPITGGIKQEFSIASLPAGIYFLHFDNVSRPFKVIKQ